MTTLPIALKSATEYPLPVNGQTHRIVSPSTGLLLVSQQPDSGLLKIAVETPVPAEHGSTPVGLLHGPDGNLWFGLLGSSSGGMPSSRYRWP